MPQHTLAFLEIQAQFSAMVQRAAVLQSAQESRLNHMYFSADQPSALAFGPM